ncbi:MAG: DNA polymerase III subunit gamma/tau [Duncaniella sp.]|nr:DNA polymerase III subunit gamma/tau [Duncaniella sp.]
MDHYLVSARKYRPSTFGSVVGQQALTATLKNAIATGRLAHSYLFCGSRGVGKTSCARIFSKTINCLNPTADGEACNECESCRAFNDGNSLNIIELDAASNNSVDDIRELSRQVLVPPSTGKYRVFIVDEVHMLSPAAFNAFLKTLEEPPSYVIFILATTEKQKILPTILSRCQIYDFKRITIRDMIDHLSYVAREEGIKAEPAALGVIARKADGAMRDALSIFDQVAASSRGNITFSSTLDNLNVLDYHYYNRLIECFLTGNVLETWMIYKEIRDRGFDSHFFINGLADYLRDLMVARDPSTISLLETDDEARAEMAAVAVRLHPEFLLRAMALCNDADLHWRDAGNKQFLVELTLAKICQSCSPSPGSKADTEGEGQLKPIGVATATSHRSERSGQASQPAPTVKTTPKAEPVQPNYPTITSEAPAPRYETPAPQRPTRQVRTRTVQINAHPATGSDAAREQSAPQAQQSATRNSDYTEEQFEGAWQAFIDAHSTRHILINTMRASRPQPAGNQKYIVTVENEKQHEEMTGAMGELLSHLRETLANDGIAIEVRINDGAPSPHTWNERQVLNHIVEHNPGVGELISTLGLTLG